MKIESVMFRDAVGINPRSGFTLEDGTVELHPSGVLLTPKTGKRVLVPFSNVRSMVVGDEAKKP